MSKTDENSKYLAARQSGAFLRAFQFKWLFTFVNQKSHPSCVTLALRLMSALFELDVRSEVIGFAVLLTLGQVKYANNRSLRLLSRRLPPISVDAVPTEAARSHKCEAQVQVIFVLLTYLSMVQRGAAGCVVLLVDVNSSEFCR